MFPAADQPGAGRERGRHAGVEMVGELDDLGAVTQAAAAVSHEHRQVDRDAAWFVCWPALPVQAPCLDEAAGQPGLVSQIGERTGGGWEIVSGAF